MGKIYETKIDTFNGGISEDKRVTDASKFGLTKHFDVFSYPHKMIPYYRTKAFAGEDKTLDIVKFIYAPRNAASTTFKLYGYGVDPGTTKAAVYMQDPADSVWSTPNNNKNTQTGRNENVFFYYKGYIYMFRGTNLSRFDVTSAGAFTDAYGSVTSATNVAEPVHHPADDIAYFFSDNYVHRQNGTNAFEGQVLTLPSNMKIVSACAYGNYLAIGCVTYGTFNVRSTVFLWDRDSSLSTISQKIDFGEGELVHLANLDNRLIGVMSYYFGLAYSNKQSRVFVKIANGEFATTVNELSMDTTSGGTIYTTRFIRNSVMYFPMKATLNGDTRLGIWACDSRGRLTLAVVDSEATSYEGIYALSNVWWIAHSNDGSTNYSDNEYDSLNPGDNRYTTTSLYESLIFNGGDSSLTKKLLNVVVTTEPMPTAGQIILKYRKDEETAWTTIFTNTTDNSISHEAINIGGVENTFPQFSEIQFQINSTGGAVVTGLRFSYETIDSGLLGRNK